MPVDTSSYQTDTPNMLATLGGVANIANAAQENRLLQAKTQQENLANSLTKTQNINNILGSHYQDANLSKETIKDSLDSMWQKGLISPQDAAEEYGNLQNVNDDPKSLQKYLLPHIMQGLNAQQKMEAMLGIPSTLNTGNKILTGATGGIASENPGAFNPSGQAIPLQMSPGEAASPVQVPGAGGTVNTMTKGQFNNTAGGTGQGNGALPGIPGPSMNIPQSQKNYEDVQKAATGAPSVTSALNEALTLASKGDNISGTDLANIKLRLAQTGIAPDSLVQSGSATQSAQKWIAQALINQGMPNSDARLQQMQAGNLKPEQLPATIRELAPYFKAQEQGAILKQNYYNKTTAKGNQLQNEPAAKQAWDNVYDPRFVEMNSLSTKEAKIEFLKKHPDLDPQKHKAFNQLINE